MQQVPQKTGQTTKMVIEHNAMRVLFKCYTCGAYTQKYWYVDCVHYDYVGHLGADDADKQFWVLCEKCRKKLVKLPK